MFALIDHDMASLEVSLAVFAHIVALLNAGASVELDISSEEEHQGRVVDQLLQLLQGELVQVVVDLQDIVSLGLDGQVDCDSCADLE